MSSKEFLLQKIVRARSREMTDWIVLIVSLWVVGLSMLVIGVIIWSELLPFWPMNPRTVSLTLFCLGLVVSIAAFSNMRSYRKEKSQYLELLEKLAENT